MFLRGPRRYRNYNVPHYNRNKDNIQPNITNNFPKHILANFSDHVLLISFC